MIQFFVERLKDHSSPMDSSGLPIRVELSKGQRYKSEGSIVNVSSIVSSIAAPATTVNSISKDAIDELNKSMAVELAPRRVR